MTTCWGTKVMQPEPVVSLGAHRLLLVVHALRVVCPHCCCAGYALHRHVMTPFGTPVTGPQCYYNYRQSAGRRCVEQVCGAGLSVVPGVLGVALCTVSYDAAFARCCGEFAHLVSAVLVVIRRLVFSSGSGVSWPLRRRRTGTRRSPQCGAACCFIT